MLLLFFRLCPETLENPFLIPLPGSPVSFSSILTDFFLFASVSYSFRLESRLGKRGCCVTPFVREL